MTCLNAGSEAKTEISRPILRYHGGKFILADWIISHFPEHRIYVEPFGGAGSVLIQKPRTYAEIYNDLDGEICNLFRVIRDRGEELAQRVSFTPFAREEYKLSFEVSEDPPGASAQNLHPVIHGLWQ